MTWEVTKDKFVADELDAFSNFVKVSLGSWLEKIDDEISYSSAFKRKKLYNIVMRVFAPIFLIVILVSAILNTLGFISL